MSQTLIQGGSLVTPERVFIGDLLIVDERIAAIASRLPAHSADEVVDASGCYVLPGVVDAHTHIQLDTGIYQTPDNWLIGTTSAACGGVTTVIDFATQFPGQSLTKAVENRLREAQPAVIDYGLHCMVTDLPPGKEDELADLVGLGVTSIKLYTTYRPNYYADDASVLRLMRAAANFGLLTQVHCENDALVTAATRALTDAGQTGLEHHGRARPALAEVEAIHRMLFLAEAADAPLYIVHCSTGRSVELVAEAWRRGQVVYAETCPQYLLLDESVYAGEQPHKFILQPPLRPAKDRRELGECLHRGAIDVIATDSCDYTLEQKLASAPNLDFTRTPGGLPGIETLLPLMATFGVSEGRLSWPELVRLLSSNPARIFGLWPAKGSLLPGADADVVIYDPNDRHTLEAGKLHACAGYSPYQGVSIAGQVKLTIARGMIVYANGEFKGQAGWGRFVAGSERGEIK